MSEQSLAASSLASRSSVRLLGRGLQFIAVTLKAVRKTSAM